ncbi:MAG: ANTAR domain-containing protein [Burkholderiaceae bacterium]
MTSAVLLDLTTAHDAAWRTALARSGVHLGAACGGDKLVQCTNDGSVTQLICLASGITPEVVAALSGWDGEPPLSVLLLTPPALISAADAELAMACGVHHWQMLGVAGDGSIAAAEIESALALARARHRHDDALRRVAARAHEQLDERKWVDRAKGVLMSARGLGEEEAFRLLRGAAMSVNLRIGELSRAVVEAARWADAMNRAGQLRMLSQRLVRLAAQQLLKIDTRDTALLKTQSMQRVRDNLEMLAPQCATTSAQPAYTRTELCWQVLAQALDAPRIDASALRHVDALAAQMLAAAELLTEALQAAAGRRALHIVNQCGRQRMRVQHIAKEGLMAAIGAASSEPQALLRRHEAALDDFEAAQRELEQAPLTSPEIRSTLEQVRDDWLRLLGGVDACGTGAGRRALVQASEALLVRLESLTAAYEHSFQVIMG